MNFIKILFAVTCFGARISVVSSVPTASSGRTLSLSSSPSTATVVSSSQRVPAVSDLEILVKSLLAQSLDQAIEETKKVYPVIISAPLLEEPVIDLGLDDGSDCLSSQNLKEKLFDLLMTLSLFKSPLYMAYSYERTQGPQHSLLALTLKDTSHYVNTTVAVVRHKIYENSFTPPSGPAASSQAELDRFTRKYLQALTDSVMGLTITDNLVKIYRNYVIIYRLHDLIKSDIIPCIKGI